MDLIPFCRCFFCKKPILWKYNKAKIAFKAYDEHGITQDYYHFVCKGCEEDLTTIAK